jgi:ribonuclease BN (tRNA processing enzyme)
MSVAGDEYRRYGGNTTCFHIEVEPDHHVLIDCGTGLRTLQQELNDAEGQRYSVLFTHYHWDHIQGLPVFMPLFDSRNTMDFYGPIAGEAGVREALEAVLRPPWWPIALDEVGADVSFRDVPDSIALGEVRITSTAGNHPQGVLAYRIDGPERSVVIATDHEAGDSALDAGLVELARGADVLIHDAQYTPEELRQSRKGWGHSSFEAAVRSAQDSGAQRLVLTSHDPDRSDEEIDRLRGVARASYPATDAAYEGMSIPL